MVQFGKQGRKLHDHTCLFGAFARYLLNLHYILKLLFHFLFLCLFVTREMWTPNALINLRNVCFTLHKFVPDNESRKYGQ